MTRSVWITDQGKLKPGSAEAGPLAGNPIDAALSQRTTASIRRGHIGLTDSPSLLVLRFDLDAVTDLAVSTALAVMEGEQREIWFLYRRQMGWLGERLSSGRTGAERLCGLVESRRVELWPLALAHRCRLDWLETEDAAALLKDGYRVWERNRGQISDDLVEQEELLTNSQLSIPTDADRPPTFVYVGENSTAARTFGRAWAMNAEFSSSVPDLEFEERVNDIYPSVLETGEPAIHLIHGRVKRPDGEYAWVHYQRLVLLHNFKTGAPVFNCLTAFSSEATGLSGLV